MIKLFYAFLLGAAIASTTHAEEAKIVDHNMMMDHGDGHLMDMEGAMVMGQNKDTLPGGCSKIAEDAQITVRGGHKYAKNFPGTMFAFDKQEWRLKPCTRLTVTFINEDSVRHQWMMHGLPKYIYDKGMFHLEVTGPGKVKGTFILPNEDKTYLVHCDIAQHMEKGMKAQLIVGKGSGVFPSIPGLTDPLIPDDYTTGKAQEVALATPVAKGTEAGKGETTGTASESEGTFLSGALIIGVVLGVFGVPAAFRTLRERCKGMTAGEVVAYCFSLVGELLKRAYQLLVWLYRLVTGKNQMLPKP